MNLQKRRFPIDPATGCLSEEDTKAYFSQIGFSIFGLGIGASIAANLLYFVVAAFPIVTENKLISVIASYIITLIAIYCIGLPVFKVLSKPLPSVTPIKTKMRIGDLLGAVCVSLAAMMMGNYLSNMILLWLDTLFGITAENPLESIIDPSDPYMVAVTVVFTVILAPILEELLFRRILCKKLLPLGEGYAILISAAAFGLIHGNFYQVAYGFLLGALFAFIYVKTGKLIYTIILHAIINFLGSVVGPYLMAFVDYEYINSLLESVSLGEAVDMTDPALMPLFIVSAYEMAIIAVGVTGVILFFKARKRNALSLESGILPPPRKGRVANLLCNVGVAAAITYFTITMVLSLLPV